MRSPEWPDPHADEGVHLFTYALYPHAGTWREAGTVRRGYELNYHLLSIEAQKHAGELEDNFSFVTVSPSNVVLTAMKKADDDDSLILRFYEWAGKESDVRLTLPPGATTALETDLMEKSLWKLPISTGSVTVPTKPYEIKTVVAHFQRKSRDD